MPYIAVVAHWVNKEWEAKEGTLLFEEMGWEYTAEDISYHVMKALKRFALDNKNRVCKMCFRMNEALNSPTFSSLAGSQYTTTTNAVSALLFVLLQTRLTLKA